MKLMRNKRTGKTAVYDQALVDGGNWEPDEPKVETVKAPVVKAKPWNQDEVKAGDKAVVTLQRSSGESIERQA